MRTASKFLLPGLIVLFLWAVVRIVLVPVESGEAYPRYSSLRPDPLGAKVLFESLSAIPGVRVERNYRPLEIFPTTPPATILLLGGAAPSWAFIPENQLKTWEALAGAGSRLVFVFQPSLPALKANFQLFKPDPKPSSATPTPVQPVLRRWGVNIKLREVTAKERAQQSSTPRDSAAYFVTDSSWTVIERHPKDQLPMQIEKKMGNGSIVVATQIYGLSNEGLREHPNGQWIAGLIGGNSRIVFDEFYHQVQDSASVGTLLRRYNLQGAVAVLSLLALLFVWRNGTGLLPPRVAQADSLAAVAGWDAQQGLTALLERSVPRQDLTRVALQEWQRSAVLRPAIPASRLAEVEQAAAQWSDSPAAAYQHIHRILTERK